GRKLRRQREREVGDEAAAGREGELQRRIQRSVQMEEELLLEPEYFAGLEEEVEGIEGVDIRLKRGRAENELTRYRYEVVVHKQPMVGRSVKELAQLVWGEWTERREAGR